MISKIKIINALGSFLELRLDAISNNSKYTVRNIEGLGPVKADIAKTSPARLRGSRVGQTRLVERDIVFRLGFNPLYAGGSSVQSLRLELYSIISTGMEVTLEFTSDVYPVLKIKGYIEMMEPTIFGELPEIVLAILCPDPFFSTLTPTVIGSVGTNPVVINYEGTVPTGFEVQFQPGILASPSFIVLQNAKSVAEQMFMFQPVNPQAADFWTMRSIGGKRDLIRTRSGTNLSSISTTNLMSEWLELVRGTNTIRVTGVGTTPKPFTVTYDQFYGGM